jgi:hypothetical protein
MIETRTATIQLGSDGIIRVKLNPGPDALIEDAIESVAAVRKLAAGTEHPLLVDLREQKSVSKESRSYYTGEEAAKLVTAVAIVVGSPVSRVIGNFYIGFSKQRTPLRLFDSETMSVDWLKGFIK